VPASCGAAATAGNHLELRATPLREVARETSRYERFWNEKLDALEAFVKEED